MIEYDALDPVLGLSGYASAQPVPGGHRLYRLSAENLRRVPTESMRTMVAVPAGVQFRFRTAATEIRVRAATFALDIGYTSFDAVWDLRSPGEDTRSVVASTQILHLDSEADAAVYPLAHYEDVVFAGLRPGMKEIEIAFPNAAVTDIASVTADARITAAHADTRRLWLHHGSSISHCLEAAHPLAAWPSVAARSLDLRLRSLSFAGNALLDPFVAREIRDSPADLISLKLGINLVNADAMRLRAFVPAVHGFLDTIRDTHPATPVLVISPIYCEAVEELSGPTGMDPDTGLVRSLAPRNADGVLTLTAIRSALSDVVRTRRDGGEAIEYLDGRHLFDREDTAAGMQPDGLHPDTDGYELMGARFASLATHAGEEADRRGAAARVMASWAPTATSAAAS